MKKSWPQLLCLDLDDTILAFTESAEPCWQRICGKYASRVDGLTAEALLATINEVRAWYWADAERHRRGRLNLNGARREIVAEAFSRLQGRAPEWSNEMADSYTSEREETVQPFPGAIEALHHLRHQSTCLALITNGQSETQRQKINRLNLTPFFDAIVIEGEFGVGKPDERVYRHVLGQFGVAAESAWMVGDNLEWDVASPQGVGMKGIWVDYAGVGLPASSATKPDQIIRHLSGLILE
jgi:putative hydrolase of the HAD superfamily